MSAKRTLSHLILNIILLEWRIGIKRDTFIIKTLLLNLNS